MKKRSQSFLRIKTMQSDDDEDTHSQWMGRIEAKKVLSKVGEKITHSMLDFDK